MKVRLIVCTSLILVGCGGKKGTIELDLVHDALSNPLAKGLGSRIEFIAGPHSATGTLTAAGGYSVTFDEKPPKSAFNLVVQVLDQNNSVVVYGETPLITLNAVNQGPFGVWIGQPGTIARSPSPLTVGTTSMAGCNVMGLGAVVGGGEAGGTAVSTSYVYDAFTSAIIDTSAMTTARFGAVAIPAGATAGSSKGVLFGGSSTITPLSALATAEAFDPTSGGAGQWLTVNPGGTVAAAAFSSVALFGDGSGLVTGGLDSTGTPTTATTAVTTSAAITFGPGTGILNAARAHHASAALELGSTHTSGAIVVGGLPAGSSGTVVEVYENGKFNAVPTMIGAAIPNLWNATATAYGTDNTNVFVMGGGVNGGPATNMAFVITTMADGTLVATDMTALGLIARKNHTATRIGDDILICGGIDANGNAIGNCDLVTTSPDPGYDPMKNPIGNLVPRENHVAVALETGPVVFIGGDDGHATNLTQIDIYTPTMAEEAIVNQQNGAVLGVAGDGGTN